MKAVARARPFWRRRLLGPFLALLGLNVAVFLVYTLPRRLQERNVASRIDALKAEVERERATATALEHWTGALRSNTADQERFYGERVGTRAQLVPLLREIEHGARKLGLNTKQGASYQAQEVKGYPLVRFSINMPLTGTYEQLASFLERLERSPQFLIVDQIQLNERRGEGGASADLSVALSAYFRKEKEAGGSHGL